MIRDFTKEVKPGDLCYWKVAKDHILHKSVKWETWVGIISKVKPALVVVFAPALKKYLKVRRPEILEFERSKDG
ncbi:MAG: hypothetical protein IT280_13205 [Ignavibacteria bacterium]|nr:hypothetical protein [Ignavibacteria bacterium]